LFNAADNAWRQRDMEALATLYDFPSTWARQFARPYQETESDADQFRAAMTAMMTVDPRSW
jgi:hypothetical protein